MSLVTALVAGGALGARHALEADHLAAVATLVDEDVDLARSGLVGASWGVGHALPIVAAGLALVALGVPIPERVVAGFELLVGAILIGLSARTLLRIAAPDLDLATHRHGGSSRHAHLELGGLDLGATHSHRGGESLVVGVVHGIAGSGVLVVALASMAPSLDAAAAFLLAFALLSTGTMAAVSLLWRRSLAVAPESSLEGIAGLFGVAIGLLLIAEQLGVGLGV